MNDVDNDLAKNHGDTRNNTSPEGMNLSMKRTVSLNGPISIQKSRKAKATLWVAR